MPRNISPSVLESGKFSSELELTEMEYEVFKNFRLITAKPMMFVCNVKVTLFMCS